MLTAADRVDTPKVEERNKDSTNFATFFNYFFSSRWYDILQLWFWSQARFVQAGCGILDETREVRDLGPATHSPHAKVQRWQCGRISVHFTTLVRYYCCTQICHLQNVAQLFSSSNFVLAIAQ